MRSNKLKQLAICTTVAGEIGAGDKLLFASTADLHRFAAFTAGTAVIVGKNTGQQMIDLGARVKRSRPLIVISPNQHLNGTNGDDDKWIYYADSLEDALLTAEAIGLELNLNGWTVAGGKRVYDDFFDLMEKTKMRLNHVYAFTHELDTSATTDVVKLKRDWPEMLKLITRSMHTDRHVWHELDVLGKVQGSFSGCTENPRANYLYDSSVINPVGVTLQNHVLRVETDNGQEVIYASTIRGWRVKQGIKSVDLMIGGDPVAHTLRPSTDAGFNSLLLALNLNAL
ncbi:MAG: dihydrofolate reductase [Pseudomonas sp.]